MRRHASDPFSLIVGVTFASLGVLFMLTRVDIAKLHLRWVWPLPLIAVGVLIIILAMRPKDSSPDE